MEKMRIFISYKTGLNNGLTQSANVLKDYLETHNYEVWMDTSNLIPGEEWDTKIYEAISTSDLVLLLLAEETAKSDWVRREIDVARGAQVFVLPVLIRDGFDFDKVLDIFAISQIQCAKVVAGSKDEHEVLHRAIQEHRGKTRDRQEKWLEALVDRKNNPIFKEPASPRKDYAIYTLSDHPHHESWIYLAAGDITELRGIDVIVNPENNYMQMARIFESSTVSSKLRLHGSPRAGNGQPREDTIQQDLYDQVFRGNEYSVPVGLGFVVPTRAGHPRGKLAHENKIRYIFHCVTISVEYGDETRAIVAIPDRRIAEAVTNCLNKVIEVNRNRGVISPPGTERRAEEEKAQADYQPITSIALPLFATGRGGRERDVQRVAELIVGAAGDYLLSHIEDPELSLKAIHISAYSSLDVETVEAQMDKMTRLLKRL